MFVLCQKNRLVFSPCPYVLSFSIISFHPSLPIPHLPFLLHYPLLVFSISSPSSITMLLYQRTRGKRTKGRLNDASSNHSLNVTGPADRCTDEGFNAMTLDVKGVMHFFRGDYVWAGFQGPAQRINETWKGLTGPVDAAFRNHNKDKPLEHQRTYVFKGDKVFCYFEGQLVSGFPRLISKEFPGIPDNVDAAVECHSGECKTDSVIFFKGASVYIYNSQEEPPVKQRHWTSLKNCTAAVRWLERYYCFNGINFTRFDPVSGELLSPKPLDTRDYFVSCPGRGHGHASRQNATLMSLKDHCSGQPFEAFSSDDKGRIYAFRGGLYFRVDSNKDGWHAWPLSHTWRNLNGVVDAAFSWENKMYFIQRSQVVIYLSDQIYIPVLGYPKSLQKELGVSEVDAAFTCPDSSDLNIIRGGKLKIVDLKQSPRMPTQEKPIIHSEVDSAMCNSHGLFLFKGESFYHYKDVEELVASTELPKPGNISERFLDC